MISGAHWNEQINDTSLQRDSCVVSTNDVYS
jgi:hypothetical protein